MNPTCKALVFRCMDFRLKLSAFSRLLTGIGYPEGTYDLISVAGSSKDFLSLAGGEEPFLLKQIRLSSQLHSIHELVLIHHDNCGTYGIANPDQEHLTQSGDLQMIKLKIGSQFPSLKIKTYMIEGTTDGNLSLKQYA